MLVLPMGSSAAEVDKSEFAHPLPHSPVLPYAFSKLLTLSQAHDFARDTRSWHNMVWCDWDPLSFTSRRWTRVGGSLLGRPGDRCRCAVYGNNLRWEGRILIG